MNEIVNSQFKLSIEEFKISIRNELVNINVETSRKVKRIWKALFSNNISFNLFTSILSFQWCIQESCCEYIVANKAVLDYFILNEDPV